MSVPPSGHKADSWQQAGTREPPPRPERDAAARRRGARCGVLTPGPDRLEELAGGLAHDFNNILTAILGSACLGLAELPTGSPGHEQFAKIRRAAKRAAALTDQMLEYAGQAPLERERVDLSGLVARARAELAASCEADLQDGLPPVEGSATQLDHAVRNLLTNAAESLEDGSGRIRVRTGLAGPARGLNRVFVEVGDSGCGMDAQVQERMFEPFFTTKFTGRGLGLAAVAGIVRSHRGALEVHSEPGRGTRVRVLLPVMPARAPGGATLHSH